MTTADDYVIQFIQDKGLVSLADVTEARAAIEPVPDGQNADTLAIAKLVETNKVAWTKITSALSQEFDMEIVDVAQVTPSDDILKLISREQAEIAASMIIEAASMTVRADVGDEMEFGRRALRFVLPQANHDSQCRDARRQRAPSTRRGAHRPARSDRRRARPEGRVGDGGPRGRGF